MTDGNSGNGAAPAVWAQEPITTLALLTLSADRNELRRLARKGGIACCERCLANDATLLRVACRACYGKNRFSQSVDRLLQVSYSAYILEVDCAMMESLRRRANCSHYIFKHLPGFLCGLAYSRDPRKRDLGGYLAYSCSLSGMCSIWRLGSARQTAGTPSLSQGFLVSRN